MYYIPKIKEIKLQFSSVPGIDVSFDHPNQCYDGEGGTLNFYFKEGGEPPK